MKKNILLSLLLATALTAGAQENFSAKANALRQKYQNKVALTRSAGQEVPQVGPFTVICKTDASPVAVAEKLKALGAEVKGLYGRNLSVTIPADKIDAMAQTEGVLLIDVATKSLPMTDVTRKVTQTDEVQTGKGEKLPQAYTGKDVVIGLIDGGFDFTHPGFKDKDGNLRIKAIYLGGNSDVPQERMTIQKTDATGATTEVKLQPGIVTDPKVILDTLKVKDIVESHGTHCAYAAAGTPIEGVTGYTGSLLGGMAPDAELILCTDQPSKDSKGNYVDTKGIESNYLDFMKSYAEKNNKELVVSWSQGTHDGFHNGTNPMAQLVGNFAKNNVLMLAAGNEATDSMYIHRTVKAGDSLNVLTTGSRMSSFHFLKSTKRIKVRMGICSTNGEEVYSISKIIETDKICPDTIGFVFGDKDVLERTLANLTPEQAEIYKKDQQELERFIKSGEILLIAEKGKALESMDSDKLFDYTAVRLYFQGEFYLSIFTDTPWCISLHVTPMEEDAELFSWSFKATLVKTGIYEKGTDEYCINDLATTGQQVTVGAWTANNINNLLNGKSTGEYNEIVGDIATFSSFGPDRAGHTYPSICAPGVCVYSAINSFHPTAMADYNPTAEKAFSNQFEGQKDARTYYWGSVSGTSMATPAAAGIVALWSQAARDKGKKLTSADIKDICAKTADNDEFTKAKPERFGPGKINAYKGLLYVLGLYDETGINGISTHQPADVSFRVAGDVLYADGAEDGTPVSLYNLSGALVSQTVVQGGTVSLSGLQKGVYAVQLGRLGSTLIRK